MRIKREEHDEVLLDRQTEINMNNFASFMAKMIEKYGDELLEEIESEKEKGRDKEGQGVRRLRSRRILYCHSEKNMLQYQQLNNSRLGEI